jgi:tyrosyl-tRNA synthetase
MSETLSNLQFFFDDLRQRGVIADSAKLDNFYQLKQNEKVVYLGIDCTGDKLHIGHLFQIIQTIRFAEKKFTVIIILGGGTSKIGDPSDKNEERPLLKTFEIDNYLDKIKSQLEQILVRKKEIIEPDISPLEQFYPNNSKLLKNIYQILGISNKDRKKQ